MKRLEGKRILVTGAAGGMGRAHCIRLAQEGASVIALDVAQALRDLEETACAVRELGTVAVTGTADIRDFDALAEVVENAVNSVGVVGPHLVSHSLSENQCV